MIAVCLLDWLYSKKIPQQIRGSATEYLSQLTYPLAKKNAFDMLNKETHFYVRAIPMNTFWVGCDRTLLLDLFLKSILFLA